MPLAFTSRPGLGGGLFPASGRMMDGDRYRSDVLKLAKTSSSVWHRDPRGGRHERFTDRGAMTFPFMWGITTFFRWWENHRVLADSGTLKRRLFFSEQLSSV